jgi:hypothetical protein
LLKLDETHVAHVIFSAGQEVSADPIVVGTHGRAGIAQLSPIETFCRVQCYAID